MMSGKCHTVPPNFVSDVPVIEASAIHPLALYLKHSVSQTARLTCELAAPQSETTPLAKFKQRPILQSAKPPKNGAKDGNWSDTT
jgi:hypothetical protein